MTKIRVLIADDHPVVRDGLVAMIGKWTDMEVVAEAQDGHEAVEKWEKYRPDVSLLDLRMPNLDGVGTISKIRQIDSDARLILLTTFDGEEDIYRSIRAGAKAYLLKDAPRNEILACITKVHNGEMVVPASLAAKLADRVSSSDLTSRETLVLQALARGKSNKAIGEELSITEATVKVHLKNIFAKLEVTSRTEAIASAARKGIVQV